MKVALAAVLIALVAAIPGDPDPGRLVDWERVEGLIRDRWPSVVSLEHDPIDDFVTIVVYDGTTETVAARASCVTVVPIMHEAGSRALFAVYDQSGAIVSSWNRCPFSRPPDDTDADSP